METACHLTVSRSDVTSSGGFSTTRRWAGVTYGGDVPVHGLLVPKTIGTGPLVPQPMDDWYLRRLVPGLLVPKTFFVYFELAGTEIFNFISSKIGYYMLKVSNQCDWSLFCNKPLHILHFFP